VPNFQIPRIQQPSLLSEVGNVDFIGSFGKRHSFLGNFMLNVGKNKQRSEMFSALF
jgi:hypothetical protein